MPGRSQQEILQDIHSLTACLHRLQLELETSQDDQDPRRNEATIRPNQRGNRTVRDSNCDRLQIGDTVLFRPPGTRSGCRQQIQAVITRFTPSRAYIHRPDDTATLPKEILTDPNCVRRITEDQETPTTQAQ